MTITLRIDRLHAYERLTVRAPSEAASLLAGGCGCEDEGSTVLSAAQWAVGDPDAPPSEVTWSGVIGVEGELTGDGRLIEPNALRWENLPIPLRYSAEDVGGHMGAVVVGRILTIERGSNGAINATGDIDMGSEAGREYARQVEAGLTPGISMDLDSVSFEIRVAKELLESGAMMPLFAEDGEDDGAGPDEDDEGRVTVIEMGSDDEVMVTTDARIRAATGVAIPAFATARISLDAAPPAEADDPVDQAAAAVTASYTITPTDPPADAVCAFDGCSTTPAFAVTLRGDADEVTVLYCADHAPEAENSETPAAVVAGAYPVEPPSAWFDNPGLTEPTPLTITEDGYVFGHLAVWGTCHTAYTGQCVEPPHSPSGYSYFRTGSVLTSEGREVAVGQITLDTLHAQRNLSAAQTLAHYEHTGRAAADVAAGEDVHGIWVAGALRSNVTPEQVRSLRASPLSGDWRRIGGSLELVGALAVNVPGFPVPRPQGLVASGVMTSLVASGMLAPLKVIAPGLPGALTTDDLRYLKALAQRERAAEAEAKEGRQTAADALAARVRATRVHAMARSLRVG